MKNLIPFYKSKLSSIRKLTNRNEKFHSLSDEDKRKEIAYDCLKLVLLGVISSSIYTDYWNDILTSRTRYTTTPVELQELLVKNDNLVDCEVCARGGIMLSTIRLGNRISPNDEGKTCGLQENLQGFTIGKMNLMEDFYEGYNGFSDMGNEPLVYPFEDRSKGRLINIFCNVIVNGDFLVGDTTDYIQKFNYKKYLPLC